MSTSPDPTAVFVVKGTEPPLVDLGLARLLSELASPNGTFEEEAEVRREAFAVAVEEHRVQAPPNGDEGVIGAVIDALFTPAFLADRRIVVLRDCENLDAAQAAELASRLDESFAPNVLVLALVAKALPAPLAKAVKAHGREIETSPGPSGKARTQWLSEQLQLAPVHLEPAARQLLERHLGEDLSRLHPLLEVLAAAYGEGGRVTLADLEPFLGDEGAAPPWDLTDALDSGDGKTAVRVAHRLIGPGGRHPFQLLATLHRHYGAMLRLDGSGITDPKAAAALLGMSPFPAQKVLAQARRLGPERVARAISLIADADLDLRGVIDWPDELVIEVLVARLAQLVSLRGGPPAAPSRRAP
ncbi:MAG: DNA polymerase III subunit delta [Acidimicrobiales bacterium]|jgi:DNA polymerase-3 subunit delta